MEEEAEVGEDEGAVDRDRPYTPTSPPYEPEEHGVSVGFSRPSLEDDEGEPSFPSEPSIRLHWGHPGVWCRKGRRLPPHPLRRRQVLGLGKGVVVLGGLLLWSFPWAL